MVARAPEVTHAIQAVHYATPTMPLNYHCTFYMRVLFREGGGPEERVEGGKNLASKVLQVLSQNDNRLKNLKARKDQNLQTEFVSF